MVSKHKVLDLIYVLIDTIEADWREELESINIWDDVQDLYMYNEIDRIQANTILALIVLAYDGNSKFLEPHKDRHDNKVKILQRLAGLNAMQTEVYRKVVFGFEKKVNEFINWYIDYQKDWRWKDIVAADEYHSTALQMSMAGSLSPDVMQSIGKMRMLARTDKKEAEKMRDDLRKEYLNVDLILEKENKPKATEVVTGNFMNHEEWVASDRANKLEIYLAELKQKEEEQDAKDQLKIVKASRKKRNREKTGKPTNGNGTDNDEGPF
jgi:hypothetical protein